MSRQALLAADHAVCHQTVCWMSRQRLQRLKALRHQTDSDADPTTSSAAIDDVVDPEAVIDQGTLASVAAAARTRKRPLDVLNLTGDDADESDSSEEGNVLDWRSKTF